MPKRLQTTAAAPTGWQPDPFGGHELRLFTAEGAPTPHVSTHGKNSYEEIPGAVVVDPPRPRVRARPAAGSSPVATAAPGRLRARQLALLVVGIILLTMGSR